MDKKFEWSQRLRRFRANVKQIRIGTCVNRIYTGLSVYPADTIPFHARNTHYILYSLECNTWTFFSPRQKRTFLFPLGKMKNAVFIRLRLHWDLPGLTGESFTVPANLVPDLNSRVWSCLHHLARIKDQLTIHSCHVRDRCDSLMSFWTWFSD